MKKRILAAALALLLCLTTLPAQAAAAYEAEPNNDYKTATRITAGEKVNGAFADGDEDWYQITLAESGALRFSAVVPSAADMELFVNGVGSDGELEKLFLRTYDAPTNSVYDTYQVQTDNLYLPAGTYFIYMYGSENGNYSFLPSFTAMKNTELEPNNQYQTATAIRGGETISASFLCSDSDDYNRYWAYDGDWYRVVCKEPTALTIRLHVPTELDVDIDVNQVAANGELTRISYTDFPSIDSVYDHADYATTAIGVAAGTYYIRVGGLKYSPEVKTGSYTITVADPVNAPSPWAANEVYTAIADGLVPNSLQKDYAGPVTRGEVAGMFVNLLEKASGMSIDRFLSSKGVKINPSAFTDTTDRNVLAANALGVINGVGSGRFDPNGTLTRAQIAAILNRIAGVLGIQTTGYSHSFIDVSHHWVNTELGWPVHAGVINGVGGGRFDPDGVLTVEQSIAMVYRTEVYLAKN